MYDGFWAGLKRATTFKGRHGTTSPRLGQDPPATHTLRAGRRSRRPEGTPLSRCARRKFPGLVIFTIAGSLLWFGERGGGWGGRDSFIADAGLPLVIGAALVSLAFAYSAATANDSRGWRAVAVVANLLFPLFLVGWFVLR
ncbi:MAG: hypothetical protein ACYTGN_09860 [Planctomycetota bacterium]|jgi:hypothetical protein